jgi:quercetin dioxygenase-like cupin family protein
MSGRFIFAGGGESEKLERAKLEWLSRPSVTGARELVVVEVTFAPGGGHNFHRHPRQEELLYVIEGNVEQWLDRQKQILGPGDGLFIEANTVHASFNVSERSARLLAILGPSIGEQGYETVDVSAQAPWSGLRRKTS